MSEKTSGIKKSNNFIQIGGTLLEKNLVLKENVEKQLINFGDGNKKMIHACNVIEKVDFMNPSLLIECSPKDEDGNVIGTYQVGVDFNNIGFGVADKTYDKDGNLVDNTNFKGIKTALESYVCKKDVEGTDEEPTRVFVKSGFLVSNEYSKDGEYKVYDPKIETYNITSSNVPEEDICEGTVTGYIQAIKQEMLNENETGRLDVSFYLFTRKGEPFPIKLLVEEDLADDFQDMYSRNDNCQLWFDVLTKQVGGKKKSSGGGFGRRESKTVSGYLIRELSVFKGSVPFEEENEKFVSKSEMKKALEKRGVMIEQSNKNSLENNKKKGNKGGIGKRKPSVSETKVDKNDETLPFKEDDEEMPFL